MQDVLLLLLLKCCALGARPALCCWQACSPPAKVKITHTYVCGHAVPAWQCAHTANATVHAARRLTRATTLTCTCI